MKPCVLRQSIRRAPLPRSRCVARASVSESLVTASYVVGKGITLFTMFYCTLNYMMYRKAREDGEKK